MHVLYSRSSSGYTEDFWIYQHHDHKKSDVERIKKLREGVSPSGVEYRIVEVPDFNDAPAVCKHLPGSALGSSGIFHVTRDTNTDPWILRSEDMGEVERFDLLKDVREELDLDSTSRGIHPEFTGVVEPDEFQSIYHFEL